MQTGILRNVDPNGRPYQTQHGNFEGHQVVIDCNGQQIMGQASCKQGNFHRMQELVGKTVIFEAVQGQYGMNIKGMKDASAPQGGYGGRGGGQRHDPQMAERIFVQGIVQAWLQSTAFADFPNSVIDMAITDLRKIYAQHFGPQESAPQITAQPGYAGAQPSAAPQQPNTWQQVGMGMPPQPASGQQYDERNPPPANLDDEIPF